MRPIAAVLGLVLVLAACTTDANPLPSPSAAASRLSAAPAASGTPPASGATPATDAPPATDRPGAGSFPPGWETIADIPMNLELVAECGFCGEDRFYHELPVVRLYADGLVVFLEPGRAPATPRYRWAILPEADRDALLRYALDDGGMRTANERYAGDADDGGAAILRLNAAYVDEDAQDRLVRLELVLDPANVDPSDAAVRARLDVLVATLSDFGAWIADRSLTSEVLEPRAWTAALVPDESASGPWPWADLEPADFGASATFAVARLTPDQAAAAAGAGVVAATGPDGVGYRVLVRPVIPGDDKPGMFGLRTDTAGSVVVDTLEVRTRDGVETGAPNESQPLRRGDGVYVIDGPLMHEGVAWYEVVAPAPDIIGWVAPSSPDTGETWLVAEPLDCTIGASPQGIVDQIGYELMHLACYGGSARETEVKLIASGGCDVDVLYEVEPAWFMQSLGCQSGLERVDVETGAFDFFWGAAIHPAAAGAVAAAHDRSVALGGPVTVRLTGQFDHPDARACDAQGDADAPRRERVVLGCRSTFVITDAEVLD